MIPFAFYWVSSCIRISLPPSDGSSNRRYRQATHFLKHRWDQTLLLAQRTSPTCAKRWRTQHLYSVSVVLLSRLILNLRSESEYTANGVYCTRITRVLIAPKFLGNLTAEICDDDDNDGYGLGGRLEMAELLRKVSVYHNVCSKHTRNFDLLDTLFVGTATQ